MSFVQFINQRLLYMNNQLLIAIILSVFFISGCDGRKERKAEPQSPNSVQRVNPQPLPEVSFHEAALNGDAGQVIALLGSGTDVNLKDPEGRTPLMYASYNGHEEIIRKLVEKGADVNMQDLYGRSALMMASSGSYAPSVKYLLEHGANPNLADKEEHFTALMYAAAEGQLDVIKILLANGADPGMKDVDGDDALKFAGDNGHPAVVSLLKSVRK
ncbi:MAG: ankyrin repeat domain-containing protein [Bacteroidales bacterium]|jgi:ankyrin repeat protein|nr:ankyrin repeat domain-containing protein [Bacteroidales bacterium]